MITQPNKLVCAVTIGALFGLPVAQIINPQIQATAMRFTERSLPSRVPGPQVRRGAGTWLH
jgi:hypothetical protein